MQVSAVGLCPNEVRLREGSLKSVNYPVIPGHQFSGVVESCGPAVNYIKAGDRVSVHPYVVCGQCSVCRSGGFTHDCERHEMLGMSLDGGLSEYCSIPARHLYRLPDQVSTEEGALIENLANALAAVRNAEMNIGERVVVIGTWAVALLAVQVVLKYSPAALVLAGTGPERLAVGSRLGATHTVDMTERDTSTRIRKALDGCGASVVLVCGTAAKDLELAIDVVGTEGRIVVEGHFAPHVKVTLSPFHLLVARSVILRANRGFMTPDYTQAHQMLSDGIVDVMQLISSRHVLEDWESAFEAFTDEGGNTVQALIIP